MHMTSLCPVLTKFARCGNVALAHFVRWQSVSSPLFVGVHLKEPQFQSGQYEHTGYRAGARARARAHTHAGKTHTQRHPNNRNYTPLGNCACPQRGQSPQTSRRPCKQSQLRDTEAANALDTV